METRLVFIKVSFLLLWSIIFAQCTTTAKKEKLGDSLLIFQDSLQAGELIIRDNVDSFFNVAGKTDMAIQMKLSRMDISRDSILTLYRSFLKKDVSNWQPEETEAMHKLLQSAKEMLDRINPELFPKEINLIKSKGLAYGNDVYYTRENTIIIPENIFINWQPEIQLRILIHELYHIISRYNTTFRDSTYHTIGFKKTARQVEIPEFLRQKMLTNPDGIKADYAIELPDAEGMPRWFVPLIVSRYRSYLPGNGSYFDHIKLELFPVTDNGNEKLTLQTNGEVFSDFTDDVLPAYQHKISSNTGYIIHPDEICADHFVMAIWKNENKKISFLPPAVQSPAGDSIINSFLLVIKSPNIH